MRIWKRSLKNCIDYSWPTDRLPRGIGYITAGVDTHPDHVDIVIMGWGRMGERWVIDHQRLQRDSNHEATWLEVYCLLQQEFQHHHGTTLRIAATCIDTGGHNTGAVYDFCRGREHEFIVAVKGSSNRSAPIIAASTYKKEADIFLFPVGKLATHGRLFSSLARSVRKLEEIKSAQRRGIKMEYSGPGLIHFRPGLDDSFYKELTTPKAKWVRRDGKDQLTYVTVAGMDDHAHDCIRYADAARELMRRDIDAICDQLDGIKGEET